MITKKMIKDGITEGVIQFVTDPDFENGGTVCQIEDNWFYFGGTTAEELSPEEYIKNVPTSDIVRDIYDVMEEFKTEFPDEYEFYDIILSKVQNKENDQPVSRPIWKDHRIVGTVTISRKDADGLNGMQSEVYIGFSDAEKEKSSKEGK